MANPNNPFHPIIYVRGYAMTPTEIDETTADPFCGFNLGSTVYRAVADRERQPRKYIFESPVIRLASDFKYRDIYEDGYDILDKEWHDNPEHKLGSRSIIIYRYYDEASRLLGKGKTPELEVFAEKLGELIIKVRDLVCSNAANGIAKADFRCYLVAHSMGGLVCRGLLQNPKLDKQGAAQYVDKFFTYATPHNGIEMIGQNVPSWLSWNDISNFNRKRLAGFLALEDLYKKDDDRVDWLPGKIAERTFCMVGTNRSDYEVAMGLSRSFAGHGSDGLVRIENATLNALSDARKPGLPCAKAFAYRGHSGFFGIVNSEESYQNLTRFLFGNVRVDIWADIEEIRLPAAVSDLEQQGKKVDALYQFEALAAPKGKLWYLTRRTAEEDSVACLRHQDWKKAPKSNGCLFLSSVFLANRAKVNREDPSLTYSLIFNVRVPDYEIEQKLWVDQHFEGSSLFSNALQLKLLPPGDERVAWQISYAWQNQGFRLASEQLDIKKLAAGKVEVKVDFDSGTTPGIKGKLRFVVWAWNLDAQLTE
ncbi:hypothetical protein A9179_09415 [Pseudomonas alcaligenes]|uniref:PGAP1-like protein n=1 Tax=Aquipseudomonas alcaligenes TaxID=43263 RepID=A0ABR7RYT4_AQUAC|nr:hypothetical protein [Pseudomonas alcaligenes]MBC9250490.1 hypothetical protein [Pseudomonas alcaligenes]